MRWNLLWFLPVATLALATSALDVWIAIGRAGGLLSALRWKSPVLLLSPATGLWLLATFLSVTLPICALVSIPPRFGGSSVELARGRGWKLLRLLLIVLVLVLLSQVISEWAYTVDRALAARLLGQ